MENNEILMKVLEKLDIMQEDISGLKQGQSRMEVRLDNLEKGQMRMDITLDRLDQGQVVIKSQVSENTQILHGLKEASRIHRAQLDNLTVDVAHIKGNVTAIGRDVRLLKQNMCDVEVRTARNWMDIAKLKKLREN